METSLKQNEKLYFKSFSFEKFIYLLVLLFIKMTAISDLTLVELFETYIKNLELIDLL